MKISIPWITYALNEMVCGRDTLRKFYNFKEIETYSPEKLQEYQFNKLKKLLVHANEHVPYYRESFKKVGFEPSHFNSFGDFQKIPVLTKAEIRNNPQEFISKDKKRMLTRYATSGSTGEPLIFYLSNERISSDKAAHLLSRAWWGINIGDKEAVLWSSSGDLSVYGAVKKIRDRCLRTYLLSAFHMSEKSMDKYMKFMLRCKPKHVFGYAHSIYIISNYAKNRGIDLKKSGIEAVFVTAETLHDFQRALIEEVFGAPVSNSYGGRDSGLVAFECKHKSMHINPNIYTEIIDKQVIITHLDSYGFPFIRYQTGDQGVFSTKKLCGCGRKMPVIEKIIGRDTDYIISPKKEFIHPLALEYIFREIEGVDYFKITQEAEDSLLVDLVMHSALRAKNEDYIRENVNRIMSDAIHINFRYIKHEEIPKTDKHDFVKSQIIGKYLKK
jgi:phenylacetate-CoA ligase